MSNKGGPGGGPIHGFLSLFAWLSGQGRVLGARRERDEREKESEIEGDDDDFCIFGDDIDEIGSHLQSPSRSSCVCVCVCVPGWS